MFYTKEEYPENIKYVRYTPTNFTILTRELGEPTHWIENMCQGGYIKVNTDNNSWTGSMSFEWLYRDEPPLTNIEEFIK